MDIKSLHVDTVQLNQYQVFHYGYPHLTPSLQGEQLAQLYKEARNGGCITSVDVNGADGMMSVIAPALPFVDVFHANVEEALILNGRLTEVAARASHGSHDFLEPLHIDDVVTIDEVKGLAQFFLNCGVALVTITLGGNGVFTAITSNSKRLSEFKFTLLETALACPKASGMNYTDIEKLFENTFIPGREVVLPAFQLESMKKNTTGAGDGFVAGLLSGLCKFASDQLMLEDIILLAQHGAIARITNASRIDKKLPTQMPKNISIASNLTSKC